MTLVKNETKTLLNGFTIFIEFIHGDWDASEVKEVFFDGWSEDATFICAFCEFHGDRFNNVYLGDIKSEAFDRFKALVGIKDVNHSSEFSSIGKFEIHYNNGLGEITSYSILFDENDEKMVDKIKQEREL